MFFNTKNQRLPKKFSLKNKSWSYRGEGNANLVLSLIGERKIMRLRKSLPNEKKEEIDRIWLELDFCQGVMQPLLGESFVYLPTVVRLPKAELIELNEMLRGIRPPYRQSKGVYANQIAIFPDLCLLPDRVSTFLPPTFCVEVKPKQGWIPIPDRRLSKCTFCLNQYFKLKQGLVKVKSHYCPLDLFSGNRARMKLAIKALLFSPQNNLKMFKNGNLIYGDTTPNNFESILEEWFGFSGMDKLIENFAVLIVDTLMSEFDEKNPNDSFMDYLMRSFDGKQEKVTPRVPQHLVDEAQALLSEPSCYKETENLPKNCVLSRILRVQKLDVLGSDEVYHLYRSQVLDDFSYVYDMLLSPRNIYNPINSYLLSTTAKDCSILMAFQKTTASKANDEHCIKDSNGVYYNFSIGLSDLDPKPVSCIEKHRKRDYDVVVSCIEVLSSFKKKT